MDLGKINAWADAIILLIGKGNVLWSAIEGLFQSSGMTQEERAAIVDAVMKSASFEGALVRMASGRDGLVPPASTGTVNAANLNDDDVPL